MPGETVAVCSTAIKYSTVVLEPRLNLSSPAQGFAWSVYASSSGNRLTISASPNDQCDPALSGSLHKCCNSNLQKIEFVINREFTLV